MSKKNKKKAKKLLPYKVYTPCYSRHPLWVEVGDVKVGVVGASYVDMFNKEHVNMFKACDVFIGLDQMWERYEVLKKPFKNRKVKQVYEMLVGREVDNILAYHIKDGGTSQAIVHVVIELINQGMQVGFGCIAAHGRTGWLLARLIKHFEGCDGDEAVRRVRKRLCDQCVETYEQIADLGCVKERPSYRVSSLSTKSSHQYMDYLDSIRYEDYQHSMLPENIEIEELDSFDYYEERFKK